MLKRLFMNTQLISVFIFFFKAKYKDPQTSLYYAGHEEFSTVRNLPSDIITGYLTLRGAYNPIG